MHEPNSSVLKICERKKKYSVWPNSWVHATHINSLIIQFDASRYTKVMINKNETVTKWLNTLFILESYTVVWDWNVTLLHKYYINRVSSSQDYIPLKCFYAAFQ